MKIDLQGWIPPNQPGTLLRAYQECQLKLLKEFARICEKNQLTWYVSWGTLLGAARHEAFIPWDDDVDVWMPAVDYLKFREVCEAGMDEGLYFQCHSENPQNFVRWQRIGFTNTTSMPYEYADIQAEWGICMDIFPIIPLPKSDDAAGQRLFKKRFDRFKALTNKYIYAHDAKKLSGLSKAYHLLRAAGSDESNVKQWLAVEQEILMGEGYADSGLVLDPFLDPVEIHAEYFEGEPVFIPFEDMMVPAPAQYEKILEDCFGPNWMGLPPEEMRRWHSGGGSDEVKVSFDEPWTKFQNVTN